MGLFILCIFLIVCININKNSENNNYIKNKNILVVFFFFSFFLLIDSVNASPIEDDCVDKKTCMVLCNYETTITQGGSYATGYQDKDVKRNLTLYYYYDSGNFMAKWQSIDAKAYEHKKGPSALGDLFYKDIYWRANNKLTLENFKCPKNGYLDTSDVMPNNSLCFDDDGKACKESGAFGSAYGEHGGFKSVVKDYDFEEQITNYSNWVIQDKKGDITGGLISSLADLQERVKTDIADNFLSGHKTPAFIANSEATKNIATRAGEEFEKYKGEELAKAEAQNSNGEISDEELNQIQENWDYTSSEVSEAVNETIERITFGHISVIKDWEGNSCDSILGSVTDSTKPAYYLDFAFKLMKYVAILILIIFTILDIIKAIASDKDDAKKKVISHVITRLIILIIIFFLPTLINFFLELIGWVSDPTCGIGR